MPAHLRGQRVVVTGGAGFIGVHSVEALLDAGAEVMVIDDLRHASYRPLPAAARLVNADIAEAPARDAIEAWKPAAILHLAAQGGVNRSWREPAADAHINVLGTVSILAAAIAVGLPPGGRRIVGRRAVRLGDASARRRRTSRRSHGRRTARPSSASSTTSVTSRAPAHSTRWRSATATCTGPGRMAPARQVWSRSRATACSPETRRSFAVTAAQTRDFTYVGDIVAANVLGLASTVTGALNIGTGRETAIGDLVRRLCALAGLRRRARSRAAAARRGDPQRARQHAGGGPARHGRRGSSLDDGTGADPGELSHPGELITRRCAPP